MAETTIGTPYYMAPELWNGKEYDSKVDVWALGVCLFEMLYGGVPFKSKSYFGMLETINTTKLIFINQPEEIQDLLTWMFEKDP